MTNPRVSIGLPVYNGERFLAQAIESVLAQTYSDFELIISDNASTDRTQEICQAYAQEDGRIRYYRNDENLGAAPNFNRLVALARGEYFRWLAHDDYLAPDFLQRCVPVLDEDPAAVLCFSWLRVVDERGAEIGTCELHLKVEADQARTRFRDVLLEWHNSYYVFGLIRVSALHRTKLILPFAHGDTVLIARLSLLGRFRQVSDYLFYSRKHPGQSNEVFKAAVPRGLDLAAYTAWYDPRLAKGSQRLYWRAMAEYYNAMQGVNLTLVDRAVCYLSFARFVLRHAHGLLWDLGGLPRRLVRVAVHFRHKEYDARSTVGQVG